MPDLQHASLALVTGGQQGIGKGIARALAMAGFDVAIADLHDKVSGRQMADDWQCSQHIESLVCDVSDEQKVAALFDDVQQRFGRAPDVLVNNAAVQFWKPLLELSLSEWQTTLNVNLTGTFLMTQRFARLRQEVGGGVIINLGSGCNKLAFPNLVSYSASKGGVEMLTKVSALELGKFGIRVNCLSPGSIETERTQAETEDYADQWSPLTPLGRVGTIDDVANAVVALTDDKLRFVSGQTINVDGGLFSRAVWPQGY